MAFHVSIKKHTLHFRFPAGTSRGVLHEKTSHFLICEAEGRVGIGEAGPLPGLSPDADIDMSKLLRKLAGALQKEALPRDEQAIAHLLARLCRPEWPSVRFALETALLDWLKGGMRILFDTPFSRGEEALSINGLIWMGDAGLMRERIQEKLAAGYSCLKMKVGAVDFQQECRLLEEVRRHFSVEQIMLRLDANGAFPANKALDKLKKLAEYQIHSIEQPLRAGQAAAMARLCQESPIDIALDEELIGVYADAEKDVLLDTIQPQYIILKPSLLGGLDASRDWIRRADSRGIGWWMTSALESNIGLNAISQFTATYRPDMPQGLGTGQLYTNNIPSPLEAASGELRYGPGGAWDLSALEMNK
jgi:o-succinylbenzoate synthase